MIIYLKRGKTSLSSIRTTIKVVTESHIPFQQLSLQSLDLQNCLCSKNDQLPGKLHALQGPGAPRQEDSYQTLTVDHKNHLLQLQSHTHPRLGDKSLLEVHIAPGPEGIFLPKRLLGGL
jgi:hypothetical protein